MENQKPLIMKVFPFRFRVNIVFDIMARRLTIERVQLGDKGGAMGAGALVLENLVGFASKLLDSNAI